MNELVLSSLAHTWVLDLDGTIVKHNGYKIDGKDSFINGAKTFLDNIPSEDMIIIVTSRTDEYKDITLAFLKDNNVRYDYIIFNAPYGERILMNDNKPSGLRTAVALNLKRDIFDTVEIRIDRKL